MIDETPRYNITIFAGTDYQMDLSIIADDDTELSNYGALIFNEILNDGTGSEIDADNELYLPSEDWIISGDTLIYIGSEEIIVGNWHLEAQLREYAEAVDYYDFDIWVDADGYHMTIGHDITDLIPFTHGVYDVFITNIETGVKSKLLYGEARIMRRTTR